MQPARRLQPLETGPRTSSQGTAVQRPLKALPVFPSDTTNTDLPTSFESLIIPLLTTNGDSE